MEEEQKMVRFSIYLNQNDADTLVWLAKVFAPESVSSLLSRCLLTNVSLTDLASEVFKRQNARKHCP